MCSIRHPQISEGARQRRRNEVNDAVKPLEEKALRNWAHANGHMLDDEAFEMNWKEGAQVIQDPVFLVVLMIRNHPDLSQVEICP
jgi:hypothetical protein